MTTPEPATMRSELASAGPKASTTTKVLRVVLPVLVIAAAFAGVRTLVATKPEPGRTQRNIEGVLVNTVVVEAGSFPVQVNAQGQVGPSQRVVISSEVPGRVRSMSPELVPGGVVQEGELLFRVDAREFSLAVQSRSAEVNRAQLELQLEQRRASVAEREWQAFGGEEASEAGRTLALRQPQQETAEVAVQAAQNAVQTARLNLHRAAVRAPFNATVLMESIDVGQYVAPGAQLATLVGTDNAWVQVSVPLASLGRIRLPEGDQPGSVATVRHEVSGEVIERQGEVVRLLPDLDPAGSMARVIVAISDPLRLADDALEGPPLLFGSYVQVLIEGGQLDAVEVPRRGVREGNVVYVMDSDNKLSVREIRVGWSMADSVLATSGVQAGDRVIISRVNAPVEGMLLRTTDGAPATAEAARE